MIAANRARALHLPDAVVVAMLRFGPFLLAVLVWILLIVMMAWPRIAPSLRRH